MAFCTNCGANVTGAFCNQCGTPARAGAGQPAAPPPPVGAAVPPGLPGAAPAKRKTSPIVWVLVIILGIFVLGFVGVVGTGLFVYSKVKQAGVDPELFRTNPGLAVSRLIAAVNPDVEVVRTDEGAGTITMRDKKSGKEVTMTFDQAKSGRVTFSAEDDNGKTATVEIGGANAKLPSWVPVYPGATIQANVTARGDGSNGAGEGGNFSFTTRDPASKVISFYQDKAKEMGFKAKLNAAAGDGGTFIAADEDARRTLSVIAGGGTGETTVNVTYGSKN
jgi:hypothetical protein